LREPDLMVKIADLITDDLEVVREFLKFRPIRAARESTI